VKPALFWLGGGLTCGRRLADAFGNGLGGSFSCRCGLTRGLPSRRGLGGSLATLLAAFRAGAALVVALRARPAPPAPPAACPCAPQPLPGATVASSSAARSVVSVSTTSPRRSDALTTRRSRKPETALFYNDRRAAHRVIAELGQWSRGLASTTRSRFGQQVDGSSRVTVNSWSSLSSER